MPSIISTAPLAHVSDMDFLHVDNDEMDYRVWHTQNMVNTLKNEGFANSPTMTRFKEWLNPTDLGVDPVFLDGVVTFSVDPNRIKPGIPSFLAARLARLLDIQSNQTKNIPVLIRVDGYAITDVTLYFNGSYSDCTLQTPGPLTDLTSPGSTTVRTDIGTALALAKTLTK